MPARRTTTTTCVDALRALGEDTRVRIVTMVFRTPLGVCEIARRLHISQYNVSKHLRILREAGLLEVEKHGRERVYRVPADIRRANLLDLGCCKFQFDRPD